MPEMGDDLLDVGGLVAGYGKKEVLRGVSLSVARGEIVAVIGHNGAGKSTLLKAVFGLLPVTRGRVTLEGHTPTPHTPRCLLRSGVSYVPQGNRVFGDLTVRENMEIAGVTMGNKQGVAIRIEQLLALFPLLGPRFRQRAGTLSGGEKQVLALATGLMTGPRLLLLDEPSLGLAPRLVVDALAHVHAISRDAGVAVLIVEQKVRQVLRIARRVVVIRNGMVSYSGPCESLGDDARLREVYL